MPPARASSRSATTSPRGCSPTTTWPRWSTPTTSGSGTGSASQPPHRRDDETVADMAAAAAEKALAGSGLTAADIDLVVVATCSSVDRCPNVATRVAAQLGIAAPAAFDLNTACSGLLLRAGHRRPRDPGRRGPQRHRDRRREAVRRHRLDRPLHLHHLRRRRRRRGGHRRPPTASRAGHRPGASGARRPDKGDAITDRGLAARTSSRRARRSSAGPPPRSRRSPCRPASGPASARPSSPRSCRTRPTAHHRRHRQAARPAQRGHRQGHRRVRQHLGGERPAGPVQAGRAAGGALRAPRCCCSASAAASPTPGRSSAARERRRRRPGTTATDATPSTEEGNTSNAPVKRSPPASPRSSKRSPG